MTAKPNNTLIRMKHVMEMTSLSKSYLYHLSAKGEFPRSVALVPGGTSKAWIKSEIQEWINERIAERDLTLH
jgi:prophage regulatory protein